MSNLKSLTAQIRNIIDDIHSTEGTRLPSEANLAARLGVSRASIREALASLATDGLIVRKHGVGSFVNLEVLNITTRLDEVWDFHEMIRLSGYEPSIEYLGMSVHPPEPKISERLGVPPDSEVLTTTDIFSADGVPVILCTDTIPAKLVTSAYREEELKDPIYEFLERRCGRRVEYNVTEVDSVIADDELSKQLGCKTGCALHYFEEVGFDSDGEPILFSEEYYRPEYFRFQIIRRMTTGTVKE